jgi:hypothetical protein
MVKTRNDALLSAAIPNPESTTCSAKLPLAAATLDAVKLERILAGF